MTVPIKVLKFINHFYIGGTERQFVHVANGLHRSQFAVEVACLKRDGPLLDSLAADMPVHTYPVSGSFYRYSSVASQLRLTRDIHNRKIDIVHTYGWYPNIFAIPPSRLALRPATIASVRDVGAYLTPRKIQALKLVCRLADCVLANSAAGRSWLAAQGVNERKIEVVRNGIDVPPPVGRRNRVLLQREFGIADDTPVCACIGRVVSGKGIDDYLRAARRLVDRGSDARFLMIGAHSVEANYKSEMEVLARELRLDGHVIFTGQRQDVSQMLAEIDVLVHPSLTEGLSNVILEAMAAGIPVVATEIGGNPELVEDGCTGFLVPPMDAEAIARAVFRLLDQPNMARAFGENGRKRVIAEFGLDRMLHQTEELYREVLATKKHKKR